MDAVATQTQADIQAEEKVKMKIPETAIAPEKPETTVMAGETIELICSLQMS